MPRAVGFTIVWPEGVIFGSIMTYHVQFLLLVRQPLFDRAALPLTQTSWVLPPLSVGKMTLRLYGALNYSHGLSKGPSFGTGRPAIIGPDWFDPTSPVPRLLGQGADRREPNSALDSSTGGSWFSRGRFILRRTERESKQVAHTKPLHINGWGYYFGGLSTTGATMIRRTSS